MAHPTSNRPPFQWGVVVAGSMRIHSLPCSASSALTGSCGSFGAERPFSAVQHFFEELKERMGN